MRILKCMFCLAIILVFSLQLNAQQLTQKYNSFYNRTEFYNSAGTMVGYAKYNNFYDRMEYYDASGNLLKTEKQNNLYNRKDINDGNGNSQGYEKKNDFVFVSLCNIIFTYIINSIFIVKSCRREGLSVP